MHNKYIFSNLIGTFIFNEHFNPIKSIMFINSEEYLNKSKYESEFLKKYSDAKKPEDKELQRILEFFKKSEYFKEFYDKNIVLTKDSIRHSVNEDNFILQAVSNIEETDKVLNTLIKRLREWYSLYNPELSHGVFDNQKFSELVLKEKKPKDSMGSEIKNKDLEPIMKLAERLNELYLFRTKQEEYLETVIKSYCPNIKAVAGTMIAAQMLAKAGSLKKLMEFPSSTIQILGAEKAFFRHLKTHSKSPKHGYVVQHPLIHKAKKQDYGKIARMIAAKISIAAKVDYFKGKFVGDKLRKELEDKLK